jgi:phosphatidylcholine synthase
MAVAVVIDAVDGTLARRVRVWVICPQIDGRKLDDIVDYVNYSFVPIILLCRAEWLPAPVWAWASIPLMASLFGFAHVGAKEDEAGFFRGFPSYWNVVVFYVAVWLHVYGPYVVLTVVLLLSLLTVLPVRFVYPTRPPCWPVFFAGGGAVWLAILLIMIFQYPSVSPVLLACSGIYPVLYVLFSIYLDVQRRQRKLV